LSAPRQIMTPSLAYDDAPAAVEYLCRAFGFSEKFRLDMPDGSVGHAELELAGGVVFVATTWEAGGMASPQNLSAVHAQVHCEVPDVNAHHARAAAEGAVIAEGPTDQFHGSRSYRAMDLEGHRWIFSQFQREVPESEMRAAVAQEESG
jgi:PhnB protein